MNNMNPFQLIQMIKGGANPQQLMMSFLDQSSNNNPLMSNMKDLIQKKDYSSLEKFARNVAKEKGLDFDKEFENFKRQWNF